MFAESYFVDQLQALESIALRVLAFALTYAIHSTVLLGATCLLVVRVAGSSLKLRERLWKVALFGGLVTAGIQVAVGWQTPLAHWTLEPQQHAAAAPELQERTPNASSASSARYLAVVQQLQSELRARQPSTEVASESVGFEATDPTSFTALFVAAPADDSAAQPESTAGENAFTAGQPVSVARTASAELPNGSVAPSTVGWRAWLAGGLAVWCAFAVVVIALFAWMWLRLARRLRGRHELVDGALRTMLDRLTLRVDGRPVRLFVAPELRTPVSFGWLRRSICVPPRALTELTREEQESMLAHEFAHLQRRDPLWLSCAWLVERVFFFQPLNRVARAELHDLAELLCDDWAAARTGNRVALASCLARIASWIVGRSRALPATSMAGAHGRSRLGQRIERLLDDRIARRDEAPRRGFVPLAIASLTGAVLVVPGVAASFEHSVDVTDEVADPRRGPAIEAEAESLACESPEMIDELLATPTSVATEPEPAPVPAPELAADPAVPSLAVDIAALDEAVVALEEEIARLRAELEQLDLADDLADLIDELDTRADRLARRRARLHQLLDPTLVQPTGNSPVGPSSVPFAFPVR